MGIVLGGGGQSKGTEHSCAHRPEAGRCQGYARVSLHLASTFAGNRVIFRPFAGLFAGKQAPTGEWWRSTGALVKSPPRHRRELTEAG